MKILIFLTFLIVNSSVFASESYWPENLKDQYENLYHVPFLKDRHFIKLDISDFKKVQYAITPKGEEIIYYEARLLSSLEGCDEDDIVSISLYTYQKEVLFASANRVYACE